MKETQQQQGLRRSLKARHMNMIAIGGAGAYLSRCIKKAEIVAYEDLGAEAVRRLEVEDMPLTVILDSVGGNLYKSGPAAYLASR